MSHYLINEMIRALYRVVEPDPAELTEVLVISGMPDKTQNIKYLAYNRHVVTHGNRMIEFSATAVINNRMTSTWRLDGYKRKLSRIVFNKQWTRNPLDIFINNIRCDHAVMDTLAWSAGPFTLFGIVNVSELSGNGLIKFEKTSIKPIIAAPGLEERALKIIVDFENRNTISKRNVRGFPLQRHNV